MRENKSTVVLTMVLLHLAMYRAFNYTVPLTSLFSMTQNNTMQYPQIYSDTHITSQRKPPSPAPTMTPTYYYWPTAHPGIWHLKYIKVEKAFKPRCLSFLFLPLHLSVVPYLGTQVVRNAPKSPLPNPPKLHYITVAYSVGSGRNGFRAAVAA